MTETNQSGRKEYVVPFCIIENSIFEAVLCASRGKAGDDEEYYDYPDVF